MHAILKAMNFVSHSTAALQPNPSSSVLSAIRLLPAERAALGQAGLTTGGLAKDLGATGADNDGLGVREDGGDGEATGALDVHEEGARTGDKHLGKVRWCLCD